MNNSPTLSCDKTPLQVQEDSGLLDLMIEDCKKASALYQPTNYWNVYEKRLLPELNAVGLHDFRRRRNSVLCSFGAGNYGRTPPLDKWCFSLLPNSLRATMQEGVRGSAWYQAARKRILLQYLIQIEARAKEAGVRSIRMCDVTRVGNPSEYVMWDGKCYDIDSINRYLTYLSASKYINFEKVRTYVELGPGLGAMPLLLHQLYPEMILLLFDLPTQQYVCESYLKAVVKDKLVSYRQTHDLGEIGATKPGHIYIFGVHKFPLLSGVNIDLFWNSASFQEMEPANVEHYLGIVCASARQIFLRQVLYGKELAKTAGQHGVIAPVSFADYVRILTGQYTLDVLATCANCEQPGLDQYHYADSIWTMRLGAVSH